MPEDRERLGHVEAQIRQNPKTPPLANGSALERQAMPHVRETRDPTLHPPLPLDVDAHGAVRRVDIERDDIPELVPAGPALMQMIDRTLANGVRVGAWICDELYGRDGKFLDALESRRQVFVAEIPVNFHNTGCKSVATARRVNNSAAPPAAAPPDAARPGHTGLAAAKRGWYWWALTPAVGA